MKVKIILFYSLVFLSFIQLVDASESKKEKEEKESIQNIEVRLAPQDDSRITIPVSVNDSIWKIKSKIAKHPFKRKNYSKIENVKVPERKQQLFYVYYEPGAKAIGSNSNIMALSEDKKTLKDYFDSDQFSGGPFLKDDYISVLMKK